jgi:hypothetical protein
MKNKKVFFLAFILPLLITGCFYNVHNFGEQLNSLNTILDNELRKANQSNNCLSFGISNNNFRKIEVTMVEEKMNKTFQSFFPNGTSLQKTIEILQSQAGAICATKTDAIYERTTYATCTYSHEFVQGMKELGLTGWKISSAQWQKNNFEVRITAKNEMIDNIKSIVINGECYEIDKNIYENSKIIKFIRKIP